MLRKRPYAGREWWLQVLTAPIRREVQPDGRIRFWGRVVPDDELQPRYLRVVSCKPDLSKVETIALPAASAAE